MRDDEDLTDLIRAAAGGDRRAFEDLVLRKRDRVVRTAFQITGNLEDAKDVAQGVFLRLWRVLQRFDLTKRFDTWLYRITVNAAIDSIRERGPKGVLQALPDDAGERLRDPASGPDAAFDLKQLQGAFSGWPRAWRPGSGRPSSSRKSKGWRPQRLHGAWALPNRRCATTCSRPGASCARASARTIQD